MTSDQKDVIRDKLVRLLDNMYFQSKGSRSCFYPNGRPLLLTTDQKIYIADRFIKWLEEFLKE